MKNTAHCFTCHELVGRLEAMSRVGNTNFNKEGHRGTFFKIQRIKEEHSKWERLQEQNANKKDLNYAMLNNRVVQSPLGELKSIEEERLQRERQKTYDNAKRVYNNTNSATKAFKDSPKNDVSKQFNYNGIHNSFQQNAKEKDDKSIQDDPSKARKCLPKSFKDCSKLISVAKTFNEKKGFKIDISKDWAPEKPAALSKDTPSMTMNKAKIPKREM